MDIFGSKQSARTFFKPLLVYDKHDAHPPSFLQPFLRAMINVFASGIMLLMDEQPVKFLRDELLFEPGIWNLNGRVLSALWEEATDEEILTAEAYLVGYTRLTVDALRAGDPEYLFSFTNDLVYRHHRYNKQLWPCLLSDTRASNASNSVEWRLWRFHEVGGVDVLRTLVEGPKAVEPNTMFRILQFLTQIRDWSIPPITEHVMPHLAIAMVNAYCQKPAWRTDVKRLEATVGLLFRHYPIDIYEHGLAHLHSRRNACQRAVVILIGIHKLNRGYMHGVKHVMMAAAKAVWSTRRRREWNPPQLQQIFG